MKYLILAVVFATGYLASHLAGVTTAAPPPQQQPLSPVPANPNIDFNGYMKIAQEAALHREMRRQRSAAFRIKRRCVNADESYSCLGKCHDCLRRY